MATQNPIQKGTLMLEVRPELIDEWDFEENNKLGLDIYKVTFGNGKKAHWICKVHKNHKWESVIVDRVKRGDNCPYCSGHRVLKGYNDMWTTNLELAKQLHSPEDGYKYMQNSNKKVDWKCPDCESIIKGKYINHINKSKLSCGNCGDGMSYPEKLVYSLLNTLDLKFTHDSATKWSDRKKYDFCIPELNMIIEAHGIQHYEQSARGRTLLEEQENDRLKEQLAKENGVEYYIVIDCRYSEFEYIKNNILESEIKKLLNIKDELNDLKIKEKSLVIESWELWNTDKFGIVDLANHLNIGQTALRKYLKNGESLGKCKYDVKDRYKRMSRKIVKLDLNSNIVNTYDSIRGASKIHNYPTHSTIRVCCKDKGGVYDNFRWMYLDDYLKDKTMTSLTMSDEVRYVN